MAVQSHLSSKKRLLRDKRSNRGRIAAALRQASKRGEFPDLGFGSFFKIADACCDAGVAASDSELDSFLDDCCGGGVGDGFTLFESKVGEKLAAADVGGPLIDLISQLLPVLLPLLIGCFG